MESMWLPYFRGSIYHSTTYIQSTNPHTTSLIVSSPLFLDLPGVILPPVKMLLLSHPLLLNKRDNPWWGAQIIQRRTTNLSTSSLILLSKTYTFSSAFCYTTVSPNVLRVPLLVRQSLFTGTRPAGPTTNTARLSPRYEGKTRGCHCSHWAPDDGRENARNMLSRKQTSG